MNRKRKIQELASAVIARKILKTSHRSESSSSEISSDSDEEFNEEKSKKTRSFITLSNFYSDMDFKSHFRISRSTLEIILKRILPHYKPVYASKGRNRIPCRTAILFSIWIIANCESFRGVSDRFGLERGHGHRIFIYICQLFDSKLKEECIQWPRGQVIEEKVAEFDQIRVNGIHGVVGCIDGTHIRISAPSRGDNSYYNRKGFHSVLLQVVCDARKKFLDVFCGWPGSSNDARMWANSPLAKYLGNEPCPLPENYHLLGDSAYPLETYLLCPYKDNGHLSQKQKLFNKKLCSTRVIIEQAIGLLKGRWRRLQNLDIKQVRKAKYYILFACILHNIAIEYNDFIECEFNQQIDQPLEQFFHETPRNTRLVAAQRKRELIMNLL